ncbi:adenosylcobinamide-GDP ribazoletransferase [Bacillus mesophilus]|uniref:Adenosylcobinamide-GDP ribazoletransferase n=1 Tax=Bacillus mesophilus TaxID=1808955 RepID=A0A6M0Q4G9_9BACI|nr:adenosylcobinamide-GDP ribazoletransferase [Bacillus mesophilus]MBM7661188.1 adenosylcobinamide-GDP ribazoletransferase [Bacillus mesophilus]NEY71285.1 adenosylcobinamide-GDP ribazoletransferase [Bacillus mesophilus]
MLSGFLLCIQFFTVIPYKKEIPWERKAIQWCLVFFPIVGLFIGLIGFLQYWLLITYTPFPVVFISLWILFYFIAITGGLHIDGWMDCSDAFFSYRDKEKRLQIMDDPRVGSFAVLSVIFLLAFRFLFLYEILNTSFILTAAGMLVIPVLTRGMVVYSLVNGKLSKHTGLAAAFQKEVKYKTVMWSSLVVILLLSMITISLPISFYSVTLVCAALLFHTVFYSFCLKQFGGINGDTLGALLEGGENFLWFILWLLLYFVMV